MLSDNQARYLEQVREIVLRNLADCDADVWLFGSFAEGQPDRASDIDVAIDPHRPLPPSRLARLEDALDRSTVPYVVQIVNLAETDPAFRDSVRARGLRWRH